MAASLTVTQLRKELTKRALDTTGLKPALVSRLDAAMAEEDAKTSQPDKGKLTSTSKPKNEDTENGKEEKRKRTAGPIVDGDGAKPTKRLKVEEISKMSVADLKAALTDKGLESTGVKRELVKRLTQALEDEDNVNKKDDDDDAQDAEPKEKMVAVIKKGCAVLDQYLPDNIKQHCHVYQSADGTEIYDAMLNQTNVGDNNNKFYVIQLLRKFTSILIFSSMAPST